MLGDSEVGDACSARLVEAFGAHLGGLRLRFMTPLFHHARLC